MNLLSVLKFFLKKYGDLKITVMSLISFFFLLVFFFQNFIFTFLFRLSIIRILRMICVYLTNIPSTIQLKNTNIKSKIKIKMVEENKDMC